MLKPAFQEACRAASRSWRARPPTAARRRWSACPGSRTASSTTPWRCSMAGGSRRCGSRSTCPITASSTRSGCSRPARRRGRSSFAACASAFRSARTSGARTRSNASSRRAAKSCSSPTPRLMSATSSPSARTSPSRASSRAGCRSSISTRSAARTSSCSTAAPSRSTPTAARRAIAGLSRRWWRAPVWERRQKRLALRRGPARDRRGGRRGRLCGLRPGPARLCREEPLSRRRAGLVGRRQFGALRRDGRRRAGPARVQA